MWIESVPREEAKGLLAELYEKDVRIRGYLPNYSRAFSLRPEVYAAWRGLISSIYGSMDPRRFELATLAAAMRLGSSYCSLAHGKALTQFYDPESLRGLVVDRSSLEEVDRAVMDLAEKVASDATTVTGADIERLRSLGLDDGEILDVVLAAAARSFFAKVLDAVGASPDAAYLGLESGLRDVLVVGKPIEGAEEQSPRP